MTNLVPYTYPEVTHTSTKVKIRTTALSWEEIRVDLVIDELVKNRKFKNYISKIEKEFNNDPKNFVNLSMKYSKYIK